MCVSLCLVSGGAVASDGAGIVGEYAVKALDKGYGTVCGLDMKPVTSGGYFRCLDFGPYRFVEGYRKVYGFVVEKDGFPFQVLGGTPENASFTVAGPWSVDMPKRLVQWWNDVVEGGEGKRLSREKQSERARTAAEYIDSLNTKDEPKAVVPAVQSEPQTAPRQDSQGDGATGSAPDINSIMKMP